MESGSVIVGVLAFAFGTFWLYLYVYGLYLLGRRLGRLPRLRRHPAAAYIYVLGITAILASVPTFFGLDYIFKIGLFLMIMLLHAQPTCVGMWAGFEFAQKEDEKRWESQTEAWLAQWEDRAPDWLPDELK